MDIKEFETLKKKIENAKNEQAKIAGAIEANLKTLKNDFDCSTIEEAEKKLQLHKDSMKESEERLAELVDALEKILPEDFDDRY